MRSRKSPTPDLLALIADQFRALAEPARLAILHAIGPEERTVTELVSATALGQGNLSKHLQHLLAAGFVVRRRHGLYVYYALADTDVLSLCDIMCSRLESEAKQRHRIVTAG